MWRPPESSLIGEGPIWWAGSSRQDYVYKSESLSSPGSTNEELGSLYLNGYGALGR